MKVLLVEPYYGGSHRAWADGYAEASAHEVRIVSHPARFWKWRMQGAFLTLAADVERQIRRDGPPDVLLCSSMLDVAAFAGAVRDVAPGVPIVTFFHESQFTYPLSPLDREDATYAMKNWASAAVSDLVIFNSEYHRDVFSVEAGRFLGAFPDAKHSDLVANVIDASVVLPVGVDLTPFDSREGEARDRLIVWNHRWQHDKGPEDLARIVDVLLADGVDFEMAMCGEVFVSEPSEFATIADGLGERLVHRGWAEDDRYFELLRRARVVLSTAHHEFFGIAVVEGIAAGARPVLPNRLVYPERVADLGGDPPTILYDTPAQAAQLITEALAQPPDAGLADATHRYSWATVAPQYDDTLASVPPSGGTAEHPAAGRL